MAECYICKKSCKVEEKSREVKLIEIEKVILHICPDHGVVSTNVSVERKK